MTIPSLSRMRHSDRAMDEAWIKDFLKNASYGALATSYEGQPFVNINLFAYNEAEGAIFLHTSSVGRTYDNVLASGRVCFSASRMGRLLPNTPSREFSVEYESVVVFGVARILETVEERAHGLQSLNDKYFPHLRPGVDYPHLTEEEMRGTAVYRIDILEWSGKRNQAAADFPGAFYFGERG